jgi:hypothetical protein
MLDQTPGPDKLVPIEDVAKQFTVSVPTIRAWQRQGLIPKDCYIHVGNTYRFHLNRIIERLLAAPKDGEPVPSGPVQLELPFDTPPADTSTLPTPEIDRDL